jgi:hypothetical protein
MLKTRDSVVVSAAEKESERGKECGFLEAKFLEATSMSGIIKTTHIIVMHCAI